MDQVAGVENPAGPPLNPLRVDIHPVQPGPSPIHPLNRRDVCAFIVNKMIGSGIFILPPAVLLLTGSKTKALILWFSGFVYALAGSVFLKTCLNSCLTDSAGCSYT